MKKKKIVIVFVFFQILIMFPRRVTPLTACPSFAITRRRVVSWQYARPRPRSSSRRSRAYRRYRPETSGCETLAVRANTPRTGPRTGRIETGSSDRSLAANEPPATAAAPYSSAIAVRGDTCVPDRRMPPVNPTAEPMTRAACPRRFSRSMDTG